jgi:hypothetical protein
MSNKLCSQFSRQTASKKCELFGRWNMRKDRWSSYFLHVNLKNNFYPCIQLLGNLLTVPASKTLCQLLLDVLRNLCPLCLYKNFCLFYKAIFFHFLHPFYVHVPFTSPYTLRRILYCCEYIIRLNFSLFENSFLYETVHIQR